MSGSCRDHSDGIWNESQATVLQVDSGTDNGTALSSSEMTSVTSPGSAILLTPSSRRKHLLMMQHQQRSSMDTEALEEEFVEQVIVAPCPNPLCVAWTPRYAEQWKLGVVRVETWSRLPQTVC